ncbi:MAG: hypothetical protein V4579_13775 [Pseudomonadota bacterium]
MVQYNCWRSHADLTATIAAIPPDAADLRTVFEAARDGGIGVMFIDQTAGAFRIPANRPAFVLIGDDTDASNRYPLGVEHA